MDIFTDPSGDIAKVAEIHRKAIVHNEQAVCDLQRDRDVALRGYEAELEAAERHFERERIRLELAIGAMERTTAERIAEKQAIIRGSEALLAALLPNSATREEPMEGRQVPRPAPVAEPVRVHRDIQA